MKGTGPNVEELLCQGQPHRRLVELEHPKRRGRDQRQHEVDETLGVLRPGVSRPVVEVAEEHRHEDARHDHQVAGVPRHDEKQDQQVDGDEEKTGAGRLPLGVLAADGVLPAAIAREPAGEKGQQLPGQVPAGHQAEHGQEQVGAQQPERPVDGRQQLAQRIEHARSQAFCPRNVNPAGSGTGRHGQRENESPRGKGGRIPGGRKAKKSPQGKGGRKPGGPPLSRLVPGEKEVENPGGPDRSMCADRNIITPLAGINTRQSDSSSTPSTSRREPAVRRPARYRLEPAGPSSSARSGQPDL